LPFKLYNRNTNRLSKSLEAALNEQMTKEAHAAQIYLSYAAWAYQQSCGGNANFLFRHSNKERNHMMKILEFILKRAGEVRVTAIPAPPGNPKSINNCFEKVFTHEVENTNVIYGLAKMSHDEEDWTTWNFMKWFVKEQTGKETLAMELLDKIKIAGGENADAASLYLLDRDLEKMPDDADLAQDATVENP
jgi:ferritin